MKAKLPAQTVQGRLSTEEILQKEEMTGLWLSTSKMIMAVKT